VNGVVHRRQPDHGLRSRTASHCVHRLIHFERSGRQSLLSALLAFETVPKLQGAETILGHTMANLALPTVYWPTGFVQVDIQPHREEPTRRTWTIELRFCFQRLFCEKVKFEVQLVTKAVASTQYRTDAR
jgi:hypothetical protein